MSNEVRSIRSLCKFLSSYWDRRIQNTVKHLRWSVLQKESYLSAGAQPGSAGKHFGVFYPRYSYNYILNEKFNPKMDPIRVSLTNIRTLFLIFKKGRGNLSSLPSWHLWEWLNMHQYPWISLIIYEKAWIYSSDYARPLNMHDHLTCLTDFWRKLGF